MQFIFLFLLENINSKENFDYTCKKGNSYVKHPALCSLLSCCYASKQPCFSFHHCLGLKPESQSDPQLDVVKTKCFLVGGAVLSDPPEWGRLSIANTKPVWGGAANPFKSVSGRPTSTHPNGFLWQLGIFMASSDSVGFSAQTQGLLRQQRLCRC